MPLRQLAARSISETPSSALQSLNSSIRTTRLSLGPSAGPVKVYHRRPSCIWAFFDSGMAAIIIFLVAMILYVVAIPPYNCYDPYYSYYNYDGPCLKPYRESAWLYLVAAILFVVESLMDLGWCVAIKVAELKLKKLELVATSQPATANICPSAGAFLSESNGSTQKAWFDTIPWDILAALWFVIPSGFYVAASLLDVNGVYWPWLVIGDMDPSEYSILMCKIAAALFVFDSILGLCGRWSCCRQTPPEERLIIWQVWNVRGIFSLDWGAWGDLCFFVGAIIGAYQQFKTYEENLDWVVELLWTVDALFYLIACWPVMRAMLREDAS